MSEGASLPTSPIVCLFLDREARLRRTRATPANDPCVNSPIDPSARFLGCPFSRFAGVASDAPADGLGTLAPAQLEVPATEQ